MKILNIPLEYRCGSDRRTVFLGKIGFDNIESFQAVELTLGLNEPFHTNKVGLVLCYVVSGWMEAHCAGRDYKLDEGQGIIFEPNERHRINKGEGWMLSLSTESYDEGLSTEWEDSSLDRGGKKITK